MQRLEKAISLFAVSGVIISLAASYSLRISKSIEPYNAVETARFIKGHDEMARSRIININTADRHTLSKLPGIGLKIAERIIEYRNANGPFDSCEEIMQVKGIGQKKYQAIVDRITIID
jgi:comEA protein